MWSSKKFLPPKPIWMPSACGIAAAFTGDESPPNGGQFENSSQCEWRIRAGNRGSRKSGGRLDDLRRTTEGLARLGDPMVESEIDVSIAGGGQTFGVQRGHRVSDH